MTQDLQVTPMYEDGKSLCSVTLESGEQRILAVNRLDDSELTEWVHEGGLEMARFKLDGDFCIINLQAAEGQWGRTVVWDYVQNRVVHLTNTPFVEDSEIHDGKVKSRYLVQYWGHPADCWHSEAPLELCDVSFEPELIRDETQQNGEG